MAEKEERCLLETSQEHALMCDKHNLMPIEDCKQKVKRLSQQMEENKEICETEVLKLQRHYDAIVEKLLEIKRKHEKTLREGLENRNAEVNKTKSSLEEKKEGTEGDSFYLLRYKDGGINEAMLESMMGVIFYAEEVITETNSFQWGARGNIIKSLEAKDNDTCFLTNHKLPRLEQVNKHGKKENQFSVLAADICVTDNNEIFFTNLFDNSISHLSMLGSVSTVFSTDPMEPCGICPTMNGELLITLKDTGLNHYELNIRSRRLVRHVTLNGDVVREYEYQEDGQTRLFTEPLRVTQNGNTDICVINWTSYTTSELVILSCSGSLNSVYRGRDQTDQFDTSDVVCDSHFNIILNELKKSAIHLLSPEGKFMRYLLTENHVNDPFAMSLKGTQLWVGDFHGFVKVFRYTL